MKIHPHRAALTAPVGAKAAPFPLVGLDHQSTLDRVAVHVAQLLDALSFTPHVEVIETFLPHRVGDRIPECGLGGDCGFAATVQLAREALLDDLHDHRGVAEFGLGDEPVEVFGHEDVSVDHEAVFAAGLFEDLEEEVAPPGGVELGLATVATASDEVQVLGAVVTDESLGHGGKSSGCWSSLDVMGLRRDGDSTHTSQSARCVGHPQPRAFLTSRKFVTVEVEFHSIGWGGVDWPWTRTWGLAHPKHLI